MATRKRMTGEERKEAISLAARKEFSMKGFYGTSMRDIARATKVSEALIYQHFPSKQALYDEIYFYIDPRIDSLCKYLNGFEPSTETLVKIVYSLSMMILSEIPGQGEEQKIFERLLVYSLLENPEFAKTVFKKYDKELSPIWIACIDSACQAGDIHTQLVFPGQKMWFAHHLAMSINILHMAGEKLFSYSGNIDELTESMVIFILRGIGLTDVAVQKYAHSEILKNVVNKIFKPSSGLIFLEK